MLIHRWYSIYMTYYALYILLAELVARRCPGLHCHASWCAQELPSSYACPVESFTYLNRVSSIFLGKTVQIFTRGHSLSLSKPKVRLNVSKCSFYSRVVGPWNLLPDRVVSAGTLPTFKFLLKTLHL